MKRISPLYARESESRQTANKRLNPGRVALFDYCRREYVAEIDAGTRDYVAAWREKNRVYILSYNIGLNYAGLNCYELTDERDAINPTRYAVKEVWNLFTDKPHVDALNNRDLDEVSEASLFRALLNLAGELYE